jgi:Spy/CpxP family protein refolding chaperone
MRKLTTALLLSCVLTTGLVVASALYAQDNRGSPDSMMGRDGMMGGGMMGMMDMMKQMNQMMDSCNKMMGARRPGEQPKKDAPATPENKG